MRYTLLQATVAKKRPPEHQAVWLPCAFPLADGKSMPHELNIGRSFGVRSDSRQVSGYGVPDYKRDEYEHVHPRMEGVPRPQGEENPHEAHSVYPEVCGID